jgi:glutathione S-transferase
MYNEMRGRRDLAIAYAATGVPRWERRTLPLAYPAVTRVIDRYLDITPSTAAKSEAQVRMVFDAVAERLSDDRPFLCGDRFSAADLTFAALAASVLMPPEYGVPLPQPEELPVAMGTVVREFRAHPAGAHALAMYRDERR